MAVHFISAEIFFFLRNFFGPKNPRMGVSIAYFVFLNQSEQKHGSQVNRPREKKWCCELYAIRYHLFRLECLSRNGFAFIYRIPRQGKSNQANSFKKHNVKH